MANSYLIATPRRTAAITGLQIATLIGSLSRSVELLTADIEREEALAGMRDLADPAYPVLARSLRKRRENIGTTIAMLENLRVPNDHAVDTTGHEEA
ncbi:hypothetical protein [Bradyrhizobium lablabi]|uniref:hypothetical protein n=1 Tax=Bradyrhizobium lablabi TaxID=722472 RepID=UPI001BADE488|nr:hypothetical protein [Bradyrhizobium lablabi]MBR0693067.1 hypothetical protein [Bradyrhizobium lablabi]